MARGNCFGSYFSKSGNRCDFSDKVLLRPSEFASARPPANPHVRAPRVCASPSESVMCGREGGRRAVKQLRANFPQRHPSSSKGIATGGERV